MKPERLDRLWLEAQIATLHGMIQAANPDAEVEMELSEEDGSVRGWIVTRQGETVRLGPDGEVMK